MRLSLAVVVGCVLMSTSLAATPEEMTKWQQIIDGWRANQAAIRTLHVEYDVRTVFGEAPAEGEAINQNRYLAIHDRDGDRFLQDCTIWSALPPNQAKAQVAAQFRKTQRIVASDGARCFTREIGLKDLVISDQPDRRQPTIPEPTRLLGYGVLDDIVKLIADGTLELTSVAAGTDGDVEAMVVELKVPKVRNRVVIWYAVKKGYLPVHAQEFHAGDTLMGEQVLTKIYSDPAGGFHYPLTGWVKHFNRGREAVSKSMTVDEKTFRVNQPLGVSFTLTPATGERIWDVDHMKELKVLPSPSTQPTTRP